MSGCPRRATTILRARSGRCARRSTARPGPARSSSPATSGPSGIARPGPRATGSRDAWRAQPPRESRSVRTPVRSGDGHERVHADRGRIILNHPPRHQTTQAVPDQVDAGRRSGTVDRLAQGGDPERTMAGSVLAALYPAITTRDNPSAYSCFRRRVHSNGRATPTLSAQGASAPSPPEVRHAAANVDASSLLLRGERLDRTPPRSPGSGGFVRR
jgi:hypothetical protein